MESVFAVVDIYWVAHLENADAVATVALTESMLTMIYTVAIGLGVGATAMVPGVSGNEIRRVRRALPYRRLRWGLLFPIVVGTSACFSRQVAGADGWIAMGCGR